MTRKWEHKTVELDLNEMVVKVDGWPILGIPEEKRERYALYSAGLEIHGWEVFSRVFQEHPLSKRAVIKSVLFRRRISTDNT